MNKKTECECEMAGYCKRHNVTKTENLFILCNTNNRYWEAWENGNGPRQKEEQSEHAIKKQHKSATDKKVKESCCNKGKTKNTTQKIISFAKSIGKFAASGFQQVTEKQKNQRLKICYNCEKLSENKKTCNECGCFVELKSSMASEQCPLNKWLPIIDINE